jgi:hypothetical protein
MDVKLPPVLPSTRYQYGEVRSEPTATATSTTSTGTVKFNDPTDEDGPTTTGTGSTNPGKANTVPQSTTATSSATPAASQLQHPLPPPVSLRQHLVHVRGSAIRYIHLPEDYTTTIRIHLDRQRNAQQKYRTRHKKVIAYIDCSVVYCVCRI